jgi:ABC-2 type transport system permease protein
MLGRELAIVLRSPLTWLQASLAALLVGHGFVLAIDVYSAGSRSVHASTLMARELDPLLGIVRPTLGGLYLSLSLLGPIVAARVLSIEKERHTLNALLLQTASPLRVLFAKLVAAVAGIGLQLVAPVVLLGVFCLSGGHLAPAETAVALLGYGLYVLVIAAIALMAAAWTETLAQAATLTVLLIVSSWAIDASEGFAALAWLGSALDWSVSTHLAPLEHGTLAFGACAWMALLCVGTLTAAWVGLGFDGSRFARASLLASVLVVTALACASVQGLQRGLDFTELRRASLPPGVIRALRALPTAPLLEVWLDRDDARRHQLESDALAKLELARPDLELRAPLDARAAPIEGEREPGYGRIIVRVGRTARETYSTSRRELVTLIFEAAGRPPPDFSQHEYPGYPKTFEGGARSLAVFVAYFGLPSTLLMLGWLCTRSRRRTT